MAQKAFMADAGVRLGEWSIVELANGDLQVSNMHTISGSQRMFRVDKGLRIGDWRMTVDGNGDMNLSETAITGSQRPFIADGGVKVGDWTIHATEDGDLFAEKNQVTVVYTLTSDVNSVDEGSSVTITLATSGVATGTTVPYTISGVASADIDGASLTGNFVTGTTDSITLNTTEDTTTEGAETLQLTLDNGEATIPVVLNDTSDAGSIDLSQYTYTVALTSDATGQEVTSVNEGEDYTITTTTDAPDGTYLWVHLVENSEFNESGTPHYIDWLMDGTQSLARKPPVSGGGTTTSLSISADNITEAGFEKFTIKISIADEWADVPDNYVTQTPEITINDTSQDPVQDASAYNWSVATTIDHPTNSSSTIDTNNYDDSNYQAQLAEGDTMTWTATTDAPDGVTVYFTCVSTYYGSYDSAGDPNWNDISGQPGTSGTLTVSNGQVSATITAIDDSTTEDGELRQVWLMKEAGDYSNVLSKSQWFHIADPSGVWSPPSSGDTFLGGEYHADSGSPQAQWYNSGDSSTGNPQVRIRMNEGVDKDLRRNISYVLDNLSVGDSFEIGNNTTTIASMLVSGNISKVQVSGNYYDYFFDVNVGPATTTYFYEYIVEA